MHTKTDVSVFTCQGCSRHCKPHIELYSHTRRDSHKEDVVFESTAATTAGGTEGDSYGREMSSVTPCGRQ